MFLAYKHDSGKVYVAESHSLMEIGGFSVPQEVFGLMSCPPLAKVTEALLPGVGAS